MALSRQDLVDWLVREGGIDPAALLDDTPLFSSSLLDSHAMVDLLGLIERKSGRAPSWLDVNLQNMDSIARILAWSARTASP